MDSISFIKSVERLIDPISVGTLHFIQFFNKFLPRAVQNRLVKSSGEKSPYMGFVVEPYAFFLFYPIKDFKMAESLLPDGFELMKTKVFDTDEPQYYCIFGCFNLHTSAFWGSRVEFYLVARDQKTNLLSWIIVDYDSNTISHDQKHGLRSPNSGKAVVTTTYDGKLLVDIPNNENGRVLIAEADLTKHNAVTADQRLWLEGNISIGYSKELSENGANIFALKFDPREVATCWNIPREDVTLLKNTWYPGLFAEQPTQIACFPYAQHFVSDSPGTTSKFKSSDEMIAATKSLDLTQYKPFSAKSLRKMFTIGMTVSSVLTVALLLALLLR